jgi:hypothetical protein
MLQAPRPLPQDSMESHFPEGAWKARATSRFFRVDELVGRSLDDPALDDSALDDPGLVGCGPDASGRTRRGMGGMAGR